MPTLVYHCPAGLSGDMNLGAMIALGVDPDTLIAELTKLPYRGWSVNFETDLRKGISGTRCDVILKEEDHDHDHSHAHGHHHHRTFKEIREAIQDSTLSPRVKRDSIACFKVLAEAEGRVHGIDAEAVHFHEVGAIDSIIDMVGAAICWDLLDIENIVCTTLEVGGGTVDCAHGRMPVPAPATTQLLKGKAFTAGATNKETTTPTGAALLVGKEASFGGVLAGKQIECGIGIGQRDDPNLANVVYVSLVEEITDSPTDYEQDSVWELAANIDDMPAEGIGYLCQQILKSGALDVWQTPAYFKKGRMGAVVHCLVEDALLAKVEAAFFTHSLTLGVRRQRWKRTKLIREIKIIPTKWGDVRVKVATMPDGTEQYKFEYDDCVRIAEQAEQTIPWVHQQLEQLYAKI